ncbi:G-protein coupled receptor 35-like [Tiliqua scincoides]|uniref:G-protein coupled receptor 35-like n=1 Tax=Tiliqua scincoides TaxID=71010 RepID=UPI003461CBC8
MVDCSNITIDENIINFRLIVDSPVVLFGGLFNGIALWVFCCRMGKWTEARVYMINLAMADFTLVFTLPFIAYFQYQKQSENDFCRVIVTISYINMPMSICILTFIALDRYIAIKHPLKAKVLRSPRKTAITCLFLWLGCVLFAVTNAAIIPFEKYCMYKTTEAKVYHVLFYTVFFFFIPMAILIFCSTQVIRCLKEKQNDSLHRGKLTRKVLRIISVNMATFFVCFLPFNLSLLVRCGVDATGAGCWLRDVSTKVIHVTLCISHLNCCLDAICYYLVAKEFQEAASFLSHFRLKQSRCNRTQDSKLQS